MKSVNNYLSRQHIPETLATRVQGHYEYWYTSGFGHSRVGGCLVVLRARARARARAATTITTTLCDDSVVIFKIIPPCGKICFFVIEIIPPARIYFLFLFFVFLVSSLHVYTFC